MSTLSISRQPLPLITLVAGLVRPLEVRTYVEYVKLGVCKSISSALLT